MTGVLLFMINAAAALPAIAQAPIPLRDPVTLNIGLNCHWQQRCMARQRWAMRRALAFVRVQQPPTWRIRQCNRNAARARYRVDWVGFDNCIRNRALDPARTKARSDR